MSTSMIIFGLNYKIVSLPNININGLGHKTFCSFERKMLEGYFKKVYKYEKLDVCKLIIENQTLRFTKPTKFEDLLDCSEQVVESTEDFVYEVVNRRYKNAPTYIKIRKLAEALHRYRNGEETMRGFYLQEREMMIVTCFSKRSNNEFLWEKYAKNHSGICLEFFLEKQVKLDHLGEIYPLEVKYYPPNHKVRYKHGNVDWILNWVTAKSFDYYKEEEVRWLFIGVNLNGEFLDIRYPKKLLKKVIFGNKVKSYDRQAIVQLVHKNFNGFNIEFAEIVIDKNNGLFIEQPYVNISGYSVQRNPEHTVQGNPGYSVQFF